MERQDKLVTNLWKELRQAQEILVKGLCDALKEQSGPGTRPHPGASTHYRLSKLTAADDIEAFFFGI